jgi:hypothetical protein
LRLGKYAIMCLHCGKKISGGDITCFEYHLAGIPGQVESCKKVPNDVKRHIKQLDSRGRNEERRYETEVDRSRLFEDSSDVILSIEGSCHFKPSRKRKIRYFPPHASIDS